MRPLVSSSVLYCALSVSISTASTTPSSQGMSVDIRSSCESPQACVTEAILSTMIDFIMKGWVWRYSDPEFLVEAGNQAALGRGALGRDKDRVIA